ncbi:MAG: EFR1 family ferrodoxin [Candidatus Bathyarchaeia archaeon]
MRGVVVYYSASGNTRIIAKAIHRGMSKIIEADIFSVKDVSPRIMATYDLIGIGSPVWFFRETANIKRFIYNMPRMDGKYCFMFCTHAEAPFWIFTSMASTLQKKGLTVIDWADWYGASNIVAHMPCPSPTHGHPDEVDTREAEDFGRKAAERFLQIVSGRTDLIPKIPKGREAPMQFKPHPIGEPFPGTRLIRKIDVNKCRYPWCKLCFDICPVKAIDPSKNPPIFRADACWNCSLCNRLCPVDAIKLEPEEVARRLRPQYAIDLSKCTFPECKLCVENCPMDSIDFTTRPPTFKYNCEGCDLCWAICPSGAVEIKNLAETHGLMVERMEKREGEHEFLKLLAEAEAKGRFRRLIPIEKIDWTKPLYKIQKIPRFMPPEDP